MEQKNISQHSTVCPSLGNEKIVKKKNIYMFISDALKCWEATVAAMVVALVVTAVVMVVYEI